MTTTETVLPLAAAQGDLVAALGELTNPATDAVNPHFGNRYPSLPALLDHVRPVLAAHGFALSQPALSDVPAGCVGVQTQLLHTSGVVWDGGTLLLPAPPDAQKSGSAITYARRYALCALLGIAGDDDDDGSAATRRDHGGTTAGRERATGSVPVPPSAGPEGASDDPSGPAPSPVEDGPTLAIGGGPMDWKAAAQRLTRAWKRNVTQTDAQQAIIAELRKQDIPVKVPRDVNEDLAYHALKAIEGRPPPPMEGGKG